MIHVMSNVGVSWNAFFVVGFLRFVYEIVDEDVLTPVYDLSTISLRFFFTQNPGQKKNRRKIVDKS